MTGGAADRFATAMAEVPVVAIVRLPSAEDAGPVADSLGAGGVRLLELTLTTEGSLSALRRLRGHGPADLVVGMGSVRSAGEAEASIDAGADFLVTPTLRADVVDLGRDAGVPVVAGAFTPSEICAAADLGATCVKLFPARSLGPAFVADVLAPLPHLRIVPTGGVGVDDVGAYRRAGAVGVGIGGALVSSDVVARGDWDALEERARSFVSAWVAAAPGV